MNDDEKVEKAKRQARSKIYPRITRLFNDASVEVLSNSVWEMSGDVYATIRVDLQAKDAWSRGNGISYGYLLGLPISLVDGRGFIQLRQK